MKILIATDGSDFSRAAIEKSREMLAISEDTQIKIIAIYEQMTSIAAEPFAVSAQYYQEMMNMAQTQAESFAENAAEQLKKSFPDLNLDIETAVRSGSPARIVVEEAKEWQADLIVVGSHGRGFWGRLTIGSVSDAIVHHAHCSVFIARADSVN